MAKEKYSLYDIMVKRGISRRMQRKLSCEINDRKEAKRKQKLMENLENYQEDNYDVV